MNTARVIMLLLLSTLFLLNTILATNDYHYFSNTAGTDLKKETVPVTSLRKQQQPQRMLVTFDPEAEGLIREHFWIDIGYSLITNS